MPSRVCAMTHVPPLLRRFVIETGVMADDTGGMRDTNNVTRTTQRAGTMSSAVMKKNIRVALFAGAGAPLKHNGIGFFPQPR